MVLSMWRSVAGPISGRSTMTGVPYGWRSITCRAASESVRIEACHSSPGPGSSISPTTASIAPVEDVVLVPHVAVERHGLNPEFPPELAHAQRIDAVAVEEVDRSPEAPAPWSAVRGAPRWTLLQLPLDEFTV